MILLKMVAPEIQKQTMKRKQAGGSIPYSCSVVFALYKQFRYWFYPEIRIRICKISYFKRAGDENGNLLPFKTDLNFETRFRSGLRSNQHRLESGVNIGKKSSDWITHK